MMTIIDLLLRQNCNGLKIKPEDINFMSIYQFTDILIAEVFEGLPARHNFSEQDWVIIKEMTIPTRLEDLLDVG